MSPSGSTTTAPAAREVGGALSFIPEEAPDWDGARTRRFALRTPQAEFVQGCRTVDPGDGWRRQQVDSPYEGLLALLGGENWKILDGVRFQVRRGGKVVALADGPIQVDPIETIVRHESTWGPWEIAWYLAPHDGPCGTVLRIAIRPPAGLPTDVTVHVMPVFDIRHMYSTSGQDGYETEVLPSGDVAVSLEGGPAVVVRTLPEARFRVRFERVPLAYRMGDGFRYLAEDGVRFRSEERLGQTLGQWTLAPSSGELTFEIACHRTVAEALSLLDALAGRYQASLLAEREALERCSALAASRGALPGVAERIFVMAHKFGMAHEFGTATPAGKACRLPEAGGWWFRTPWFRDVFEGFLANWRTLMALGLQDRIACACETAARLIDPISGRIPNRLPERREDREFYDRYGRLPDGFYHSVDATTLLFTLLDTVDGHVPLDEGLFEAAFRKAFEAFRHARPDTPDGTAVVGPDGLLRCVPWHSWTDGKRDITFNGITVGNLPLRVPRAWQLEDLMAGRTPGEVYREQILPTFLLPEINAQWLRMLDWGLRHLPEADPLHEAVGRVRERALAAYRPTFWDEERGFLFNLIDSNGREDKFPGSPGMVAVVLLARSGIFSDSDLRRVWETCRERLAVHRDGRLFGVVVKASEERIYYGDAQYHEAVCWPRDSAYLASLLETLGEHDARSALLAANLAHQQSEGVLFYNHELFSLPEGKNPSPQAGTADFPVPVKNPMQWWSQWCDAYLYDEKADRGASGGEAVYNGSSPSRHAGRRKG